MHHRNTVQVQQEAQPTTDTPQATEVANDVTHAAISKPAAEVPQAANDGAKQATFPKASTEGPQAAAEVNDETHDATVNPAAEAPQAAEVAHAVKQATVAKPHAAAVQQLVSGPSMKVSQPQMPLLVTQEPIPEPPKPKVAPEDAFPSQAVQKRSTGGCYIERWLTKSSDTDPRCSCIAFIASNIRLKLSFQRQEGPEGTTLCLLAKNFQFQECDLNLLDGPSALPCCCYEIQVLGHHLVKDCISCTSVLLHEMMLHNATSSDAP